MNQQTRLIQFVIAMMLIVVAAASRLLPHPLNFTPIAAIALFGGVYLDKRYAFAIPLIALLASDAVIGFYSAMPWVYGSFIAVGLIGLYVKKHKGVASVIGGTLTGSILFFVVTNFGVWVVPGSMYPPTWNGLAESYIAAIPFFRNSLAGDLIFTAVLFGLYESALSLIARSAPKNVSVIQ